MICGKCGKQNSDNAQFCVNCGEALVYGVPTGYAEEAAAYNAPPSGAAYANANNAQINRSAVSPTPMNYSANNNYRHRERVKDDRNLLLYIIFSIITCGIYGFYFTYALAKDVNTVCDGDGSNTSGLILTIVLGIVSCGIYSYYWGASIVDRLKHNAHRYGTNVEETGTSYILWMIPGVFLCFIGPFIACHILIKNMNKLAKAYNEYYGL